MANWADIATSSVVVLSAGAFLVRRIRAPKKPACAPAGDARPQVIVGSRLAKAMQSQKPAPKH